MVARMTMQIFYPEGIAISAGVNSEMNIYAIIVDADGRLGEDRGPRTNGIDHRGLIENCRQKRAFVLGQQLVRDDRCT